MRRLIPETVVEGKRLGRHVNHDPRSLAYQVGVSGDIHIVLWDRQTVVLDQGNLGSCTGNAACGVLGTSPVFDALPAGHVALDEKEAVTLYSQATQLDSEPGTYPPTDTGSDGLSVAKAAKAQGLISGYLHATSIAAMNTALMSGPVIVGVNWYEGFDNPDRTTGLVTISGSVRGGHEFEVVGYDPSIDTYTAVNSWGTSWGVNGRFRFTGKDMARLLKEQGDCTQLLPLSVPAPIPTPTPTPVSPFADISLGALVAIHRLALEHGMTDGGYLTYRFDR